MSVGIAFLLKLTPEQVTDDIMKFVSPKQTLRDKALIARRNKRSRKLTIELNRIRDALEATGKGSQFTLACASSLLLMMSGCVIAVAAGNLFLVPVFAVAFALIPFYFAKKTINFYDMHIKEELETALSIITTSYVRSDNIVSAVGENIRYLKPPVRYIFAGFAAENMMISSDIKKSIENLKDKIDNGIFHEWCDTLIACQDDHTLNDTLMPVVGKLTDVRIVNNELKTMITDSRKEYWMMAVMVVCNVPLLYFLNKDWYAALMYTAAGKFILALSGAVIIITAILMFRFTKPIEYRR
jgi:Flp pilus assembly protein TadB